MKNGISLLSTGMLMLVSPMLYAAEPKFSIVPKAGSVTAMLLPANFTETVHYKVTNNTRLTRTLTMVPITGVSQVLSGANICGNPFTLSSGESCTLSLTINGSKIPAAGIQGGPVICKTNGPNNDNPDPFLCSQPKTANVLAVSTTSKGQHAYVANQLGNSVSFCQVNPVTGLLSQCAITATGTDGVEGVGFNPANKLFYSANLTASTITVCDVNHATGALSACVNAGGSGFSQPDAVAFSPDGSIFYTANVGGSVSACLVDSVTGQLSSCVNNTSVTFGAPSDMALNKAGTLAYVSNRGNSTVSVCNVSGQTVSSCNNLSGSLFDAPEGVTLSPSGLHAYIANAENGKVIVCDVRQDGTGLLDNCAATHGQFHGTGNVAFNNLGTLAYVPNQLINTVFTCDVMPVTGKLSKCKPSLDTGFDGPSGVVVN